MPFLGFNAGVYLLACAACPIVGWLTLLQAVVLGTRVSLESGCYPSLCVYYRSYCFHLPAPAYTGMCVWSATAAHHAPVCAHG